MAEKVNGRDVATREAILIGDVIEQEVLINPPKKKGSITKKWLKEEIIGLIKKQNYIHRIEKAALERKDKLNCKVATAIFYSWEGSYLKI